jgi:hypothetical protein
MYSHSLVQNYWIERDRRDCPECLQESPREHTLAETYHSLFFQSTQAQTSDTRRSNRSSETTVSSEGAPGDDSRRSWNACPNFCTGFEVLTQVGPDFPQSKNATDASEGLEPPTLRPRHGCWVRTRNFPRKRARPRFCCLHRRCLNKTFFQTTSPAKCFQPAQNRKHCAHSNAEQQLLRVSRRDNAEKAAWKQPLQSTLQGLPLSSGRALE